MSKHKAITKLELERVLEYLRLGFTVKHAAESIERSAGSIYIALNSEEWKERYEEARAIGAAPRNDENAERMRAAILTHAEDGNSKALEIGSRWVPELRDTKRVEVTGADGAALGVTVDHDFGRIIDKLEQVGLLRRGPSALVDAEASDDSEPLALLPARTD